MMVDFHEHVYWLSPDTEDCEVRNRHLERKKNKATFENYCLILPDISIGNVGQLAVDLLLNNLEVKCIGRILHPCFQPFVGGDPFHPENKNIQSSCQIYECKEKKLLILQIRSCMFRSKYSEFKDLLLSFIKHYSFKQTVIVASSSSEYFPAEQLQDIPLHYLSTSKFSNDELKQLKWKEFSLPNAVAIDDLIPGSFLSSGLMEAGEKESLPLITLICVCSEGDNSPEAFQMVNCINSWLKLKEVQDGEETWKIPTSWDFLYGSSAPPEIY